MKKALKIVFGIFAILLGLVMTIFAWYFFFCEETAIICLASLYVALLISALIITIGTFSLINIKEN